MTTKKLAACAVMTALLLVLQLALGFVSGIELVTVFLLCFCYTFGIMCGMITATAFSLLRCLIWGFVPNVIVLYLIYYNLFALIFGFLGSHKKPLWLCPVLLSLLMIASAYFASAGIPISVVYQGRITVMLWILYALLSLILALYVALIVSGRGKRSQETAAVTALAAFCTVCFTFLDDIITPVMLGYSFSAAMIYFYNSFIALLPQTLCVAVSVFMLFYPLKTLMQKATSFRRNTTL